MRYAQIYSCEVANGNEVGTTLFVQGCHFHCQGCFNQETWDFNGGKEWNDDKKNEFLKLIDYPYIKRITILGGEPLAEENINDVWILLREIKEKYLDKKIWLYSGYTWDQVFDDKTSDGETRRNIISMVNVFVDGRFIEDKKDFRLQFRGSSNQRLIDVEKSFQNKEVILWKK